MLFTVAKIQIEHGLCLNLTGLWRDLVNEGELKAEILYADGIRSTCRLTTMTKEIYTDVAIRKVTSVHANTHPQA